MSDPRRLLDGGLSERERALLEAGRNERPSPQASAALHAALGLAAPVPAVPSLARKWWVAAGTSAVVGGLTIFAPRAEPPAPVAKPPVVQAVEPAAAAPPVVHTLADELAALERVRGAQPAAGRVALDDYFARFPHGQLREEALALEIRIERALGHRAQADALAKEFMRKYPTSVHASRVRSSEQRDAH